MSLNRVHQLTEENRNKRRDKKTRKKKVGMRVDDSARKLAQVKRSAWTEIAAKHAWRDRDKHV